MINHSMTFMTKILMAIVISERHGPINFMHKMPKKMSKALLNLSHLQQDNCSAVNCAMT